MRVIDHFYDAKTGERGTREIECPDVITQEESTARDKVAAQIAARQTRMAEIKEKQLERFLSGEAPDAALVAEYSNLKKAK